MFDVTEKDLQRLWSKVARGRKNECWPWTAKAKLQTGYGVLKLKSGKQIVASRIVCFVHHGPAPFPGAKALHSCDNPTCCNPSHLRWGTQGDNVQDAINRRRHINPPRITDNPEWEAKWRSSMRKGEDVTNTNLTDDLVREVWRLHIENKSIRAISEIVRIKQHIVADICRGRSWRHLPDAPSIEALKAGGIRRGAFNQFSNGGDTRALNPRTKIPSSEIPVILARLKEGETLQSIGDTYGVLKSAIWHIKKKHAA